MTEIGKKDKLLVKSTTAIAQFDPRPRKELIVRGLTALTDVQDADFYFFKGEDFRLRGKYRDAISNYNKAIHIDPEHENSLFWAGYCYLPGVEEITGDDLNLDSITRNERAASAFQKLIVALEKDDSIWWVHYATYYNLGLAQYNLSLYKAATKSFARAIELNSDFVASYYILGASQKELGIYHSALENFEAYLEFEDHELPENEPYIAFASHLASWLKEQLTDDYFFSIGSDFWKNGQYKRAKESYEKVIELDPDYTNAYYNLALAQDELSIYHLALENFETYLNFDDSEHPKTSECVEYAKKRIEELEDLLTYTYFYNIAIKFWGKDQYQEAIKCYERAINLNPSFANAYYNLALAQERVAQNRLSQPVLPFAEFDQKKATQELHRSSLDNFEKYLRFENHDLSENQEFITYANNRMKELREILRKNKNERKL